MTALTICVPVHDRAAEVALLLSSVKAQWRPGVEVVVSDNGSTDGTWDVVRRWRRGMPKGAVRAHRCPTNEGYDANVQRVVRLARGSHAWVVGSDDVLFPGAVARVLDTVRNCPGALVVGDVQNRNWSGRLDPVVHSTSWPDYSVFRFSEPGDVARYLSRAQTSHATLPFLSAVIFPRSGWREPPWDRWARLTYSQLYGYWRLLLDGAPLVYRAKTLVTASSGFPARRDSETMFAALQSADVVEELVRLFPARVDRQAFRRAWRFEYPAWRIKSLRERCGREPQWPFVEAALRRMLTGRCP